MGKLISAAAVEQSVKKSPAVHFGCAAAQAHP